MFRTHLATAVKARSTLSPDRALVSMKGTPNSCTDSVPKKPTIRKDTGMQHSFSPPRTEDKRSLSHDACRLFANPAWSDIFLAVCASTVEEIDTAGVTILRPRCSFESNTFYLNKCTYSDIKMLNVHFTFASGPEMSCF